MSRKPSDLTLTPNLSEEGGTGPLRMRRPVYVDLLPPCNHACPASENIQAWLAEVEAGRADEAEIVLPSHRASHVLRRGIVATVSFARAD